MGALAGRWRPTGPRLILGGGPRGANSGRLAIWVGGDKAVFDKYKSVLDAMGAARDGLIVG